MKILLILGTYTNMYVYMGVYCSIAVLRCGLRSFVCDLVAYVAMSFTIRVVYSKSK